MKYAEKFSDAEARMTAALLGEKGRMVRRDDAGNVRVAFKKGIYLTNHACRCLGCGMPSPFMVKIGPGAATYRVQLETVAHGKGWSRSGYVDIGVPVVCVPDAPCVAFGLPKTFALYQFMRHCCSEECRKKIDANRVWCNRTMTTYEEDSANEMLEAGEIDASDIHRSKHLDAAGLVLVEDSGLQRPYSKASIPRRKFSRKRKRTFFINEFETDAIAATLACTGHEIVWYCVRNPSQDLFANSLVRAVLAVYHDAQKCMRCRRGTRFSVVLGLHTRKEFEYPVCSVECLDSFFPLRCAKCLKPLAPTGERDWQHETDEGEGHDDLTEASEAVVPFELTRWP
jgi:hypothetical protein